MRILIQCYEFPPLGGGAAKVVYGLSTNLIKLGHEVDIVTMGYKGLKNHEIVDGVNVYRIPCIRLKKSMCYTPEMFPYIVLAFNFTRKLAKQKNYDINHTHFIFPDGIISYFLKILLGLPYIITTHGSDVPGYNPDRFKFQHKLLSPFWKRITLKTESIICPSEHLLSLILKQNPGVETCVIPNGIDVNRFNPNIQKQDRILVVTRMFERKGVQYFLKALEGLKNNFEVNIVGDGPFLEPLKRIAESLNVKVNFLGFLDNQSKKLKDLYETSRIFVFVSEVENFPNVLLEAMTAGMAIITTKGTGCAEVVKDTALLVEPRDTESIKNALKKLSKDQELCHKLGSNARKRLVDNFSWKTVTQQYIKVYRKYGNDK
ncbi:MAG: glycosyltransferase family 4 protein [Candidatus Anammoxibacter sp.]